LPGPGEFSELAPPLLPSRLGDLGERRKLPQRGRGRRTGRKWIWCTLGC